MSKLLERLFQDQAQVSVDRALAELRAGRPIVIETARRPVIVAAVDALSPAAFSVISGLGESVALALSAARAQSLGLATEGPIAVPIAGLGQDAVHSLAAAPDAACPDNWIAADATAAAGIELCKQALLLPAVLVAEASTSTPLPLAIYRISYDEASALVERERHPLEIVSRASVPLAESVTASFVVFRGGPALRDQVAIVVGNPDPRGPVLVRLHSACLTGDLFGSLRCDCGDQLRKAIACLAVEGGVLLYLDQEGRGTGIRNKMRAYALQDSGLDTIDADAVLGYGVDERRYDLAAAMLQLLGFRRIRLITNNLDKVEALRRAGIDILGRRPLMGMVTAENVGYLSTKARRAGHLMHDLPALPKAADST